MEASQRHTWYVRNNKIWFKRVRGMVSHTLTMSMSFISLLTYFQQLCWDLSMDRRYIYQQILLWQSDAKVNSKWIKDLIKFWRKYMLILWMDSWQWILRYYIKCISKRTKTINCTLWKKKQSKEHSETLSNSMISCP